MAVGLVVLYAAFAAVLLWLLGELLLQHRAPVHWRALAMIGFLGLAAGVYLSQLPLIGAGVPAFAVGQLLVTRAVKGGAASYWSLRAEDGSLPQPLERVPLVSSAFPAAETPEPGVAAPEQLVGEVGPIESVDQPGGSYAQQPYGAVDGYANQGGYGDQGGYGGYSGYEVQTDYVQQPYSEQQPAGDYGYGYEQQQAAPQVQPGYDYQQQYYYPPQQGYQEQYGQQEQYQQQPQYDYQQQYQPQYQEPAGQQRPEPTYPEEPQPWQYT